MRVRKVNRGGELKGDTSPTAYRNARGYLGMHMSAKGRAREAGEVTAEVTDELLIIRPILVSKAIHASLSPKGNGAIFREIPVRVSYLQPCLIIISFAE